MSMVVQHNLTAMNSNRMLGITTGAYASATEKLSSGYRINRAADDAAGLAISEKMRKQIRGLTQASDNAEDGISAVQTAEGALTEVHDMLQRMNELAVKAANGTESESDRESIQAEIDQLVTEIDRVAETTKFNETYLLKGDGTTYSKALNAHDAGLDGTLTALGNGKSTFTVDELKVGDSVTIGGTEYTIAQSGRTNDYRDITGVTLNDGDTITQDGITYTVKDSAGAGLAIYANNDDGNPEAQAITVQDENGNSLSLTVRAGATVTYGSNAAANDIGTSVTLVGGTYEVTADDGSATPTKITLSDTGAANAPTWAAGDTIVDKDGVEYTYVDVSENAFLNDVMYTESGFYKTEGNTASDKVYEEKTGDVYTIAATGESGSISNGGIQSLSDIQEAIKGLANGSTVTVLDDIGATAVTYTVGVTTDATGATMTADDIAARISEGQYVGVAEAGDDGTDDDNTELTWYYAVPSESDSSTKISAKEAYNLMADELEAASSIGADKGSEASVKYVGDGTFEITQATAEVANAISFNLHVGADADMTNKIGLSIQTISAAGLGIQGLNVGDGTGNAATYAVDAIADAIATVSAQRSALGAVQNRLEHTINNLDNVVENTTSAESQIRDTDMASEMVNYSKYQILQQAGTSMLAQANSSSQNVLSLLG